MGKSGVDMLISWVGDITKGGCCFEWIPGRKYAIMRAARHSKCWEIHDIYDGRRVASWKICETFSGSYQTYVFYITWVVDVVRVGRAVYEAEQEGGKAENVIRTVASIVGGWLGGYVVAIGGYKAGEFVGNLFEGSTKVGVCAVVGGYLGGAIGAHYGNKFIDDFCSREHDD